jgi:hypothetical protein
LNDPAVVDAVQGYVRIIIRRPHAYFFLENAFADAGGIESGIVAGCRIADGTIAPLPGFYVMNAEGDVESRIALTPSTTPLELVRALSATTEN